MSPGEAAQVLGIRQSCGPDGVRTAYIREAKAHHPDAGGDESAFKRIGAAYEVLRGKNLRFVPPVQHQIIIRTFAGDFRVPGASGEWNFTDGTRTS